MSILHINKSIGVIMTNVILCGGNGTRLWPLSRTLMPKQFIKIIDDLSLFQETVLRNNKLTNKFLIVCNEAHYFIALDQIEDIKKQLNSTCDFKFILESQRKDTAAAIVLATLAVKSDEILFVTPSDHLIKDEKKYLNCINKSIKSVKKGFLNLFGIQATSPETAYGYIKANKKTVEEFCEKPDLEQAKVYIKSKKYFWNSGMFCFKAGVLLSEVKRYYKDLFELTSKAYNHSVNENPLRIPVKYMQNIPSISIDYAVMEHSKRLKLIKANFIWSDLGSFDSISEHISKEDGNGSLYADEKPLMMNSKNNLVISKSKKISLLDVDDLIVVDTADALLITKKGKSQNIKELVEKLKVKNPTLVDINPLVHRPWGTYNLLDENSSYKFKTITVKPGKRLSLQKHFHRNEHWVVVSGTATVTIGETEKLVKTNESVYIPMGEKHRLSNDGKINLTIVEVQVGQYLQEDDIVRFEDDFKR